MTTSLFPADNDSITIKQGSTGDCYLLASLDCILNTKAGNRARIKDLFTQNADGSITLRLKRSSTTPQINSSRAERKYAWSFDQDRNEDVFTITADNAQRIDSTQGGVESNSLAVKILEHIIPYYFSSDWISETPSVNHGAAAALPVPAPSVAAHNRPHRFNELSVQFIGTVLGVPFDSTKKRINDICKFKELYPEYDAIYVSANWGRIDQHGQYHGRHALRLHRIYLQNGERHFELVNPWDNQKFTVLSESDLENRAAFFNCYGSSPEQINELKVVSKLSLEDGRLVLSKPDLLQLLLDFASPDKSPCIALYKALPQLINFYSMCPDAEKPNCLSAVQTANGNRTDFIHLLLQQAWARKILVNYCLVNRDVSLFMLLDPKDFEQCKEDDPNYSSFIHLKTKHLLRDCRESLAKLLHNHMKAVGSKILTHLDEPLAETDLLTETKVEVYLERLNALTTVEPRKLFESASELVKGLPYPIKSSIENKIHDYLSLQIKWLATQLGQYQASQFLERLTRLHAKHPNEAVEVYILKRHEQCSNVTKGFGLSLDAGLDAYENPSLAQSTLQSRAELYAAQCTQSAWLDAVKRALQIHRTEMTVSPVKRAYQTARAATFRADQIDQLQVDNLFSEAKFVSSVIRSGIASRPYCDIAQEFTALGYANTTVQHADLQMTSERALEVKTRAQKAAMHWASQRVEPAAAAASTNMLRIVVGHGAMNKAILEHLPLSAADKPAKINHLPFGAQYNIIGFRKPDGSLRLVWDSMSDRYHQRCKASALEDYFLLTDSAKQNSFITDRQKRETILDELNDFVFGGEQSSQDVEQLLTQLLEKHLPVIKARIDNPLYQTSPTSLLDAARKVQTFFTTLPKQITNFTSGKLPELQQHALERLQLAIDRAKALVGSRQLHEGIQLQLKSTSSSVQEIKSALDRLQQVRTILQDQTDLTKVQLKKGKVVNLCDAWSNYTLCLCESVIAQNKIFLAQVAQQADVQDAATESITPTSTY